MRIKQRPATIPPGMGIVEYLQFDGKQSEPAPATISLAQFRDRYIATHKASLESNTLATAEMHFRHLSGFFGESFPISELSLGDLQRFVDHRTKADGINGRQLSAVTIRKEIVTLRTAWNWGLSMKLLAGNYTSPNPANSKKNGSAGRLSAASRACPFALLSTRIELIEGIMQNLYFLIPLILLVSAAVADAEEQKKAGPLTPKKQLVYAAFDLDVEKVKELIANPRLVAALLKHGADVKAVDTSGDTPLHWAVRNAGNDAFRELTVGSATRKPPPKAPPGPSKVAQCVKLLIEAGTGGMGWRNFAG